MALRPGSVLGMYIYMEKNWRRRMSCFPYRRQKGFGERKEKGFYRAERLRIFIAGFGDRQTRADATATFYGTLTSRWIQLFASSAFANNS
ncbi:hypothetical protein AVEN_250751-1 [Araneus ventricosus]|uniref:Uncharacterized protein n=1 Tax=Araneus ventricosus TaxID=182803 RepID=A0A4Y2DXP5_ARAVE|nr:hypothetical protein AVEN_250751-1 [Araneus ventricosus]